MSREFRPVIDRKRFCQILDALGCSCSPPVPGTDTGWSLNPYCLMHGKDARDCSQAPYTPEETK